ncbi:hypothetical protein TDB9533_02673 [Thalassocella blandensis]|nr:hypothetical protein TDB9533_02673 [Thalassocella blandensis]
MGSLVESQHCPRNGNLAFFIDVACDVEVLFFNSVSLCWLIHIPGEFYFAFVFIIWRLDAMGICGSTCMVLAIR